MIPSHLRLDLGVVWEPIEDWELGLFGQDLLEPYHLETMYTEWMSNLPE